MNSHWLLLSVLTPGSMWSQFQAGAAWGSKQGAMPTGWSCWGELFSLYCRDSRHRNHWTTTCLTQQNEFHVHAMQRPRSHRDRRSWQWFFKGTEVQAPWFCSSSQGLGISSLRLLGLAIWMLIFKDKKRVINDIAWYRTMQSTRVECILQFILIDYWLLFSLSLQCLGVASICH